MVVDPNGESVIAFIGMMVIGGLINATVNIGFNYGKMVVIVVVLNGERT